MSRTAEIIKKAAVLLLVTAVAFAMSMSVSFAEVTSAKTPDKVAYGTLNWERSLGTGWSNEPTSPLVIGESIYVQSGKYIKKINKETGAVTQTSAGLTGTPGYAMFPLAQNGSGEIYAFVTYEESGVQKCKVQALDASTLDIKWTSSNAFEGQNVDPLIYKNGCVYGSTWGDSKDAGTFFCLNASDGTTEWKHTDSNGYYWMGAAFDDDGNIYAGAEADGRRTSETYQKSTLCSFDSAGNIKDTVPHISGGIRCTIQYYKNCLYFTTDQGKLYKVPVSAGQMDEGQAKCIDLGSTSTNTPVIYNDNIYVGTDAGTIAAYSTADLSKSSWSVTAPGAVKGEMLLSEGYDGKLCLYSTYNKYPGGIWYIELSADGKTLASKGDLFIPAHQQYCVTPLTADSSGTIYYRNDSGYIMAVKAGYTTTAPNLTTAASSGYSSAKVTWKSTGSVSSYSIERSTDNVNYSQIGTASSSAAAFSDSGLVTGKRYYYRVRGYCGTENSADVYTSYSAVKSAVPSLSKPYISTRAGKRKITVSWKKVAGASGYRIYRSYKKTRGYKLVKTVGSSAAGWTNSRLGKGKIYYYKIKAYRNVSGKKVYSVYSNVSYKKVK